MSARLQALNVVVLLGVLSHISLMIEWQEKDFQETNFQILTPLWRKFFDIASEPCKHGKTDLKY